MLLSKLAKIALLGGPGVGKDTFVQIVQKHFSHLSIQVLRLAKPLYEVQDFIYRVCSREIAADVQDGVLLNFLGKHMRQINPRVLTDRFFQLVQEIESETDLIFCCDARPIDIPVIKEMEFTVVHIVTSADIALERRKKRGDLTLGQSSHVTESGVHSDLYDFQMSNHGTMEEYEKSIVQFMNQFI